MSISMGARKVYRVRFNLGRGDRYMKWQVKHMVTGVVEHYEPSEVSLVMLNAKLKNQKAGAKRIFEGANKSVVAWIECEDLFVLTPRQVSDKNLVKYNPRRKPYWEFLGSDVDGQRFPLLITTNRKVVSI